MIKLKRNKFCRGCMARDKTKCTLGFKVQALPGNVLLPLEDCYKPRTHKQLNEVIENGK